MYQVLTMPKVKSHRASAKRFKLNSAGTLLKQRKANRSHLNTKVSGIKTLSLRANKQIKGKLFNKIKQII